METEILIRQFHVVAVIHRFYHFYDTFSLQKKYILVDRLLDNSWFIELALHREHLCFCAVGLTDVSRNERQFLGD